jgi:hypothetical protein
MHVNGELDLVVSSKVSSYSTVQVSCTILLNISYLHYHTIVLVYILETTAYIGIVLHTYMLTE